MSDLKFASSFHWASGFTYLFGFQRKSNCQHFWNFFERFDKKFEDGGFLCVLILNMVDAPVGEHYWWKWLALAFMACFIVFSRHDNDANILEWSGCGQRLWLLRTKESYDFIAFLNFFFGDNGLIACKNPKIIYWWGITWYICIL